MKTVPVGDFGRDHWSTLAYIETLCVDARVGGVGEIDKRRMRANPKRHPMHAVNTSMGVVGWKAEWGTRLSGYFKPNGKFNLKRRLPSHDDWDCLNDMEAAGLVEILSEANGFIKLTDKGIAVAGRLREWKAKGGSFATFSYAEPQKEARRA